jgi:hypothetical protein
MASPRVAPNTYGQFILIKSSLSFDGERIVFETNGLVQLQMPAGETMGSNHMISEHDNWPS